jgi:hypothetical protein
MNRSWSSWAALAALGALSLGFGASGCNSSAAHRTAYSAPPVAPPPIDDRATIQFLSSPELEGRGVGTAGLERAATYIAADFTQIGLKPLPGRTDYFQPFETRYRNSPVKVMNVLGCIRGRRADEYIVVGAHFDHLGRDGIGPMRGKVHPGADDNASGTTAMLMLASRFAARSQQERPERSIIFAAFTAEEIGLRGSRDFVNDPPVPLSGIVAMLNLDMVGRLRTGSITGKPGEPVLYVGGSGTAAAFDDILDQALTTHPDLELVDLDRGGMGPSDHMSFAVKKIPVLFLFTGLHPDYHRPTDVAEKINYRGLEEIVDFAANVTDRLLVMPRQQYISDYDIPSPNIAMAQFLNALMTAATTQGYSSTKP